MSWPLYLTRLPNLAETVPPTATVVDGIQTYILGYGVLGVVALVLAWVVYKGSFVPAKTVAERIESARADLLKENERITAERVAAVEAGRVDLLRENDRLRETLAKTEAQRDEALNFVRDKMVPLLQQFLSATGSLLPILQELARVRDDEPFHRRHDDGRR